MPSPKEVAASMIARLNTGFENEHHWQNWQRTYKAQVDSLPHTLRKAVWAAWENATATEFSK